MGLGGLADALNAQSHTSSTPTTLLLKILALHCFMRHEETKYYQNVQFITRMCNVIDIKSRVPVFMTIYNVNRLVTGSDFFLAS